MVYVKALLVSFFFLFFLGINLAADPSYNFIPASGTTLKLYCNYIFNVGIQAGGQNYNAFDSAIKFDTGTTNITHISINSPFAQNQSNSIVNGIYRTNGSLPGGQKSFLDVSGITFGFRSAANITQDSLWFTTYTGGSLSFGGATTDDGNTLNGFDVGGADILTAASAATYSFIPLPCLIDTDSPIFSSIIPTNGSRYISSNQIMSFLSYDWVGAGNVGGPLPLGTNNRSHYRYSGQSMILSNYSAAPITVDNQEGVNSSSLKVIVSCSSCSSFGGPYVLSGADLTIITWTGDTTHNRYTWDNADRGYLVSFAAPHPYEIEKQVTVQLQAIDNPNENSQIHTGISSISFNAPQAPVITRLLPIANTFVSPQKTNLLRLYVSDDWAGIDTGAVKITIPSIMSGSIQLLTGYTYSGSDLHFILSGGSLGLGNSGSYLVEFYPLWDFPANASITMTGSAADLASNVGTFTTSFITRPDCSYFGCNDILTTSILGGMFAGTYPFSGSVLIITGTNSNSSYPYLTGINNDILMCGTTWTGAVLTGNIQILDSNNVSINGALFTGKNLYITGLNFTVSHGVILVQ